MMTFSIMSALAGAMLGAFFRVGILVPLALALAVVGFSLWLMAILGTLLAIPVALCTASLGYGLGSFIASYFALRRNSRHSAGSVWFTDVHSRNGPSGKQ